jgi:hypothetical protein
MAARILRASLWGGLTGGTIDIAYALIVSAIGGMAPARLLQIIAAGLVGREAAFEGGIATAALGLALHFAIAIVMALVFCAASMFVPALRRHWYVTGPLYGAGLYGVMNYVVLPLSALAVTSHPEGLRMIGELVSHTAGVGLAIAYFARQVMGR